jgi:hypothetical protein
MESEALDGITSLLQRIEKNLRKVRIDKGKI